MVKMIDLSNPFRITLGSYSRDYCVIQTTAPRSYDYDAIPLLEYEASENTTRFILIPTDRIDAQQARYLSGLHGSKIYPIDEATIREKLADRLYVSNGG